jgi:uncharacterized protein (TIGR04562 family)
MFPLNLLFEVIDSAAPETSNEEIQVLLNKKFEESAHRAEYLEKRNDYTAADFRFIKFVARKLITLQSDMGNFRFFFPFEIQVVESKTYFENLTGPGAHSEYKNRQNEAARRRILGLGLTSGES